MLIITMSIFYFNGCDRKRPMETSGSGLSSEKQLYQFDVREKIPDHIQSVEKLSIFPGDIDAPYSITLIEEERFGENGEPFLVHVSSCVVDDQGRVIVWSANSNYEQQLFVFDSDGTFRTKLGRQGKGPGEYGIILGIYSKNNTIFVLDYTSQRLNEYYLIRLQVYAFYII
ncbi:MAG: 6-bladed beta-propeller [Balneolaceae bacterium]|nr:6-bladed beta-propeller [Balneolaceae bacterium]